MKVRFGDLQIGDWFKEIDEGHGAFTFSLEKMNIEEGINIDGTKYFVNAGRGHMRTYFDDDTIIEKVS